MATEATFYATITRRAKLWVLCAIVCEFLAKTFTAWAKNAIIISGDGVAKETAMASESRKLSANDLGGASMQPESIPKVDPPRPWPAPPPRTPNAVNGMRTKVMMDDEPVEFVRSVEIRPEAISVARLYEEGDQSLRRMISYARDGSEHELAAQLCTGESFRCRGPVTVSVLISLGAVEFTFTVSGKLVIDPPSAESSCPLAQK